jgi:ribosome-associated toxin RatA of RatAB toxin-antitoxin module
MQCVKKSSSSPTARSRCSSCVDHVEDYPKFLPWCAAARVLETHPGGKTARLDIDYHGVKSHWTTDNANHAGRNDRHHPEGRPFRQLHGEWRFRPLRADACKVEFDLTYEFASGVLEKVIGPVFSRIANSFIDAFVAGPRRCTDASSDVRVEVAYAASGVEALVEVHVGHGAVVADAVALSGLIARLRLEDVRLDYAIHGPARRGWNAAARRRPGRAGCGRSGRPEDDPPAPGPRASAAEAAKPPRARHRKRAVERGRTVLPLRTNRAQWPHV